MSLHDISLFLLTFRLQCWPLSWVWSGRTWNPRLWTPHCPRKRKCIWTARSSVKCCTSVSSCFFTTCRWWKLYRGEVSSVTVLIAEGWQLSSLWTVPDCEGYSFYLNYRDFNGLWSHKIAHLMIECGIAYSL